jgi:hypothetical protein
VILALAALSFSLTLSKLDVIALGTSFEDIRFASRSLCLGWPTGILGLPNGINIIYIFLKMPITFYKV